MSFTLPLSSVEKFEPLFKDLENTSKHPDIEYFAISMTTLEEVFLRLGKYFEISRINLHKQNKKPFSI